MEIAVGAPKHYGPYKAAYTSMPPHAFANPEVKQMYINGHFCYAYKFGMVTNGLDIVRDIAFYDADYISFNNYKAARQQIDILTNGLLSCTISNGTFLILSCSN